MIAGAGLAGLIAAYVMPDHAVMERCEKDDLPRHSALLRFRSRAIADLTGIDFKQVTVHKGIWLDDEWQQPTITNANMYAQKVSGRLVDRSIWDLAPAERWIAPEDFHDRLIAGLGTRIHWGEAVDFARSSRPVISTVPMPAVLKALGIESDEKFDFAPIYVKRYRVVGANCHQTIYFPSAAYSLYRASIVGDLLICEFTGDPDESLGWVDDVVTAFAIGEERVAPLDNAPVVQPFGKIVPLPDQARKALVLRLTQEHGIFFLGRYALWRNILLDDVVKDATIIKRLITASAYERRIYY